MGVVDKFEDGQLHISYMKRIWLFLQEAEIHLTEEKQVIVRNIQVKYSLTAMMRSTLNKNIHKDIVPHFDKLIS